MNTPLSYNDPDLRLARKIGSLTGSGLPLAEELRGHSAWMDALLLYKSDQPEAPPVITWDQLAGSLKGTGTVTATEAGAGMDTNTGTGAGAATGTGSGSSSGSGIGHVPDSQSINGRQPGQKTIHTLYPVRYIIAAAALIFLALSISIFLYTSSTTTTYPVLVESTETRVEFTAPDGSVITLRPYTRLRELSRQDNLLAYSVEGEAFFDVVHNPGREFRVETGNTTVQVLGTRFSAGNIGGRTMVWLESGSVRLTSPAGAMPVVLEPGFTVTVDAGGNIGVPQPANADEAAGWLNNHITFTSRPVGEIMTELEHHFNIRITIPAALAADTISGRIMLDDAAGALDDAGTALGGRFEKRNDGMYVFITY